MMAMEDQGPVDLLAAHLILLNNSRKIFIKIKVILLGISLERVLGEKKETILVELYS